MLVPEKANTFPQSSVGQIGVLMLITANPNLIFCVNTYILYCQSTSVNFP